MQSRFSPSRVRRPIIDDWRLASLLFNIPVTVGQSFLLAGTMQFCRRPHVPRVLTVLTVGTVLWRLTFTFIFPFARVRIPGLAMVEVVVGFWTAVLLWKYADEARGIYAGEGVNGEMLSNYPLRRMPRTPQAGC